MMKKGSLLLLGVSAIFVWGCPVVTTPCQTDADCASNEICDELINRCVEVDCRNSAECDDADACTEDACSADGVCSHAPITCLTLLNCPADCAVSCTNGLCTD